MDSAALQGALGAALAAGLLGGVHCVGMCGGIVAAFAAAPPRSDATAGAAPGAGNTAGGQTIRFHRNRSPALTEASPQSPAPASRPAAESGAASLPSVPSQPSAPSTWRLPLAFNAGRIATYAAAGAAAGTAGSMALFLEGALPVQLVMYLFANLMLAGLGLYLLGITRYLRWFEKAGGLLWRRIQPQLRHFLPADTVARALALGALWGALPCGLVYSMLALALLTGSAWQGAALLLAFGIGTLPNLLFAGVVMRWLGKHRAGGAMRALAGAVVLAFGLAGLAHAQADGVGQHALAGWFCLTPH